MTHEPPHEARDTEKLEAMIAALLTGNQLPAVVAFGTRAISGSHRLAAAEEAQRISDNGDGESQPAEFEVIELDDEDYLTVCQAELVDELEDIGDYNDQCAAVYRWAIGAGRTDVAAALEDQI